MVATAEVAHRMKRTRCRLCPTKPVEATIRRHRVITILPMPAITGSRSKATRSKAIRDNVAISANIKVAIRDNARHSTITNSVHNTTLKDIRRSNNTISNLVDIRSNTIEVTAVSNSNNTVVAIMAVSNGVEEEEEVLADKVVRRRVVAVEEVAASRKRALERIWTIVDYAAMRSISKTNRTLTSALPKMSLI